jgi:hypothetical protein
MDTPLEQKQAADPALQLANIDLNEPIILGVKKAFETTVRDCTSFIDQCRTNYDTRFALWNGQSSDGRKHAREGSKVEPTPWEGASDMKVFLTDEVINAKVATLSTARRRANLVSVPINGGTIDRAKQVGNFMRWLINTQIPECEREDELLAQYIMEKGVGITGQFWETTQERTLVQFNFSDLQAQNPDVDLRFALENLDASVLDRFAKGFDLSLSQVKRKVSELLKTGTTQFPVLGAKRSRPVIRAFNLDEDIFIPPHATDLETAPYIFRVQYFTPEQMRCFVHTEGWDAAWVENTIETCRGKMVATTGAMDSNPISRNFIFRYQRQTDLIGVVYAYQRLSDEDGYPGIYLTIFNPFNCTPDYSNNHRGYAKHGLMDYVHGQYPFVLHRREYLSRRIHDSRGIPELGSSFQNQIKAHRDARIDAASIAIIPPLLYPIGRPPARWGPGARIPERRPNEYHFADRPVGDTNTERSEEILTQSWKEYTGQVTPNGDQRITQVLTQFEIERYLSSWAKAYRQVWKLYQQYGESEVIFRVLGSQSASPTTFQKGSPKEDYELYLSFDALQFDREALDAKLERLISAASTIDRNGQTDWGELYRIVVDSIDPTIGERIIKPKETATSQAIDAEQQAISQLATGIAKDYDPAITPPELAMQVLQQFMQQPDVAQRFQQDEMFRKRMETRIKQVQFQNQQRNVNSMIGKMGALQQGPGGPAL